MFFQSVLASRLVVALFAKVRTLVLWRADQPQAGKGGINYFSLKSIFAGKRNNTQTEPCQFAVFLVPLQKYIFFQRIFLFFTNGDEMLARSSDFWVLKNIMKKYASPFSLFGVFLNLFRVYFSFSLSLFRVCFDVFEFMLSLFRVYLEFILSVFDFI